MRSIHLFYMTHEIWQDPPTIPLLQWLAHGSLQQHLAQAVRLWVWLHLLYGGSAIRLSLPEPFTYADWRDAFFLDDHPTGEAKPSMHSSRCPCAKTAAAWLFAPALSYSQLDWEQYRAHPIHGQSVQAAIAQFQQDLSQHHALPTNIETVLHDKRLFGVTRRTLANDLQMLTDIHWLRRVDKAFRRVEEWPKRPLVGAADPMMSNLVARDLAFLTQPDLAAIAANLSNTLSNDHSSPGRFFVHVDYVVASERIDLVDTWQAQLQTLWQHSPVPPIRLGFQQAGVSQMDWLIVYPVCIYYYRRGPYLCGYGQVLGRNSEMLDWRNYRLDRIQSIDVLSWDNERVPGSLLHLFKSKRLPMPDDIQAKMATAWGFDYYQPIQVLLLRFDQVWNQRYIQNSLRHETFQAIEYGAIAPLIKRELMGMERKYALELWRSRSARDAYYQALYRRNDPNVHQRIRAWRPHVEVLLPWELRQQMTIEIQQETEFYGM